MPTKLEVRIFKKRDDPLGITRVSLGTGPIDEGMFVYCVYRGSKEEALACLRLAAQSMQELIKTLGPGQEPDISPDDGKQFA